MSLHCHSCTAPLDNPDFKGASDIYCKYCTDDQGRLLPRDVVKRGIADWLKMWQGDIGEETALARAEQFMRAMPAWAGDQ